MIGTEYAPKEADVMMEGRSGLGMRSWEQEACAPGLQGGEGCRGAAQAPHLHLHPFLRATAAGCR